MAKFVESCSLNEWAEKAIKLADYTGSLDSYIVANVFSIMQFVDEEVDQHKAHRAFKLVLSEGTRKMDVAWLSIYFVSSRVMRVRGLVVHKDFRRRGFMTYLLKNVIERYQSEADRIISFSLPSSIQFHEKVGFKIETRFVPRSGDTNSNAEKLTLLVYDLNRSIRRS